ncbi:hypothetical protein P3X46_028469 [Hevea brasiliensis]|uniref:Uncharacterized protein n=1 Tax=Hevea brasiliensis TaxID=3981 RepID=A0ABQ9KPP9_HEVBR|nr:hypothetical protein P3X46_028469 [Hevea brasiliensis]
MTFSKSSSPPIKSISLEPIISYDFTKSNKTQKTKKGKKLKECRGECCKASQTKRFWCCHFIVMISENPSLLPLNFSDIFTLNFPLLLPPSPHFCRFRIRWFTSPMPPA